MRICRAESTGQAIDQITLYQAANEIEEIADWLYEEAGLWTEQTDAKQYGRRGDTLRRLANRLARLYPPISEFQTGALSVAATAWPNDVPGPALADALIARLCEETGELARAVRKLSGPRLGHPDEEPGTPQQVQDELGDVLFLCARLAGLCGVSLSAAAVGVLAKVQERAALATEERQT